MTIHKWFVGAFLTVIMVLALAVNAFLFSARAFQYNLAQFAPDTSGVLSLQTLRQVDEQITQIANQTAGRRGERAQIEERIRDTESLLQQTVTGISSTTATLAEQVSQLEGQLGMQAAQTAASEESGALEARAAAVTAAPAAADRATGVRESLEQLRQLKDAQARLETERLDLLRQQANVGRALAESDGAINALKQSVVGAQYEQYERVRSEAEALRRSSPYGVGSAFVSAHPTFLSTLLVLLMGALGAILYLFPAYMSRATPVTFAEIIVRMVFGMVTALAFYIVANAATAGLALVPGQTESGNAALLNPFAVGLVGIIAGVTADDIAKWIQRRGSEILGGQPGQPATTTTTTTTTTDVGFTGVNPHGGPPPV